MRNRSAIDRPLFTCPNLIQFVHLLALIQFVRLKDSKLVLQNIKVFCEHWYGPFRNGEQLGGCAIQDSAFASTQALDPAEVIGVWEGKHVISSFNNAPEVRTK